MVLGRVAVFLLIDAGIVVSARDALKNNGNVHEDVDGQITSTRDAFVIIAFNHLACRGLVRSPSEGHPVALTANGRVWESSLAPAARWAALVQILTNEKPRKKPARSADRETRLATFPPQFGHFSNLQ